MTELNHFSLPNGLRVVHQYDPTVTHVAIDVIYNVGARDENPQRTGLAHLMEHLMFNGSTNVPDFDEELERAGGSNNAWTSSDFTNFYDLLPACNIETALRAESDRMMALNLTEESLEIQRSVVMEEFKQVCLNRPYGDIGHLLRQLIYTTHPYRYPTVGKELSHLEAITLDEVRDFYMSHYAPNNALLSIVGPIAIEETKSLVDKWFGSIPTRSIAPRAYSPEPPVTEPRTLHITSATVPNTRIIMAVPMCGRRDADYEASDIITDILASGYSSPFHRNLLMGTDMFTSVDASISGTDEAGYLMLSASLRGRGAEAIEQARSAIWDQATSVFASACTDDDLTRAVNRMESNLEFSRANYFSRAQEIALDAIQGVDYNDIVPRYRALTPQHVTEVAQRLLDSSRLCTLIYEAV